MFLRKTIGRSSWSLLIQPGNWNASTRDRHSVSFSFSPLRYIIAWPALRFCQAGTGCETTCEMASAEQALPIHGQANWVGFALGLFQLTHEHARHSAAHLGVVNSFLPSNAFSTSSITPRRRTSWTRKGRASQPTNSTVGLYTRYFKNTLIPCRRQRRWN